MQFCDECGSMMRTEDETWVCRSCGHEEPRDAEAEEEMTTREDQRDDGGGRDDGAPDVVDATRSATETMEEPCPAEDCDSDEAYYQMLPKPGGSYEFRLFTCVACGHKWRDS